ncbi:MAG TPA: hypothetical protein VLA21_12035, partial [Candidatus Limnocylindria bacterium]|nr:hypothetical protein [Candidatus Limnocylindria bacterium]
MKRTLAALTALCLLLATGAFAQEGPGPLTLAEIEQFTQALLLRAIADGLTPTEQDGVYAARGNGYEVLLASPDLSRDTQVLGAAVSDAAEEGEESALPRGIDVGMPAGALLALFPGDNPGLAGTRGAAVLYIRGALPGGAQAGFVVRDGQEPLLIEFDVYSAVPGGVARAGMQFTLEDGALAAARAFADAAPLSMEEAAAELEALSALQEEAGYADLAGDEALPLSREDMVLAGVDFFEADAAGLSAALGAPGSSDAAKDSDGAELVTLQWDGVEAVLRRMGGDERAVRLTVTGRRFDGPRGIRVGDTLATAIGRFA